MSPGEKKNEGESDIDAEKGGERGTKQAQRKTESRGEKIIREANN